MQLEYGKYLSVFLISMLKFVGGPLTGLAASLGYVETVVLTVLGMMTTIGLLTLLGPNLRQWVKKLFGGKHKKKFSTRNRRFVKLWQRFGVVGVSFLTPLILTPIVGALLANTFSSDRKKIMGYMLLSAVFWGLVLSAAVFAGKDAVD